MAPPQGTFNTNAATTDEETMAQVVQIADGIAFPMTMYATIELGLLDIIAAAGPGARITGTEVASKLPVKGNPKAPEMVDRMLRLLAAFSVVSCSVVEEGGERRRVFGLTPVSRYFVKDEDGVSMGALLMLHQDKLFIESWYKLKDAVLEGGVPFDLAHGISEFELTRIDNRFNKVFNLGMFNHSTIVMKKILQSYKGFDNINSIVDVGGGLGHNLKAILTKYPKIKGINFDLPQVIETCIPHPGMELVGGNMFESVPRGDAIFMKWILHDWSDEHCIKLLKNCHKSTPNNGKVIVVDLMVSDEPETTTAAKDVHELDMIVMAQNTGGKERTKQEFLALAKAAGFAGVRFECYVYNLWVMELHK